MHVLRVRNVCEALPAGVKYLLEYGQRETSRAGSVLVAPGPVTTVYERPQERVLFSEVRDANPFFHLYEAIWMLAGRNDAASLTRYVRNFDQFAEPGGEIHGAYGRRWRSALGFDQLDHVVETLRRDPSSRQCVIQMWDATERSEFVGGTGCDDLRGVWRDRPCNTHVYLRVRGYREETWPDGVVITPLSKVLDILVSCRSNDMILGGYGANAVHFSVLQEYLAARIGVGVGRYEQVSFNCHVYEAEIERLMKRALRLHAGHHPGGESLGGFPFLNDGRYQTSALYQGITATPMFESPERIDEDVRRFCIWHDRADHSESGEFANSWLGTTAVRAARAHLYHRSGEKELALKMAWDIEAADWRIACTEWIQRRIK